MTEQAEASVEEEDTGGAPHAQSKLEDGPVIGGGNEALTEQQENFAEQEDNSLEVEGRENQSYLEQPEVGDGAVGEQEFQVEPHANEVNEDQAAGQLPTVASDQNNTIMGSALTEACASSPLSWQATELHQEATELHQEATELHQEATELHQEVHQESLLKDLREALAEQEKMKLTSAQLQHRIAEYLSRKKTEEQADPGRSTADLEKRYVQCLASLDVIHSELQSAERSFQSHEVEMVQRRDGMLAQVQKAAQEFVEYRREKTHGAIYSRTGRKLTSQEVDSYQTSEGTKEQEVTQARVENFKLLNKIQKLEALLKEKDQLAEGLHMIDFEQLKINNVDLNEKIEERNEDIIKLKQKVTSTVQVLTHIKEKLQFLEAENKEKRSKLLTIEAQVANKRDLLTRSKQARDALRADNVQLKQRGGLVGHRTLLGDYEDKRNETEELKKQMQELQEKYTDLIATCERIKTRISQTS